MQTLDDLLPITGPLNEIIVLLEVIIVFLSMQLGIIILVRHFGDLRRIKTSPLEICIALLLFAWGAMWIFFIIGSHIAQNLEQRAVLSTYGYFSVAIGSILYVYYMEQHLIKRAGIITILYISLVTIMVIYYSLNPGNNPLINLPAWGVFFFLFLAYIVKNRDYITINKNIVLFFIGGFGLIIGFIGTMDFLMEVTQSYTMRLIGEGFQIGSLSLLTLFFSKVEDFSEYDWQKSIKHIFLEYAGGISIFAHNFKPGQDEFSRIQKYLSNSKITLHPSIIKRNGNNASEKKESDRANKGGLIEPTLEEKNSYRQEFSGVAIFTIKQFLQQVVTNTSEEVSSFRSDDAFITIEYGKNLIGIAVSDKKLYSIERLLRRFIDTVETVYSDVLPNWGGDLEKISAVKDIFASIFEVKKR